MAAGTGTAQMTDADPRALMYMSPAPAPHTGVWPASAPPGTSVSDPVKPIVFYIGQGVPDPAAAQLAIGSLLVVIGSVLLLHNLGWLHWPHWMRFDTLWPLLLVALGLGLVLKSRRPSA